MLYRRLVAVTSLSLLLIACGGGGSGGGGGGNNTGGGGSGNTRAPIGLQANFQSIQSSLFTSTCAVSGCHTGDSAPAGLRLSAGESYDLLVGVPSVGVSSVNRIEPGDPDNSYLIWKLEGNSNIVGNRMPRGGPFLAQSDIDAIRQWISDGALAEVEGSGSAEEGGGDTYGGRQATPFAVKTHAPNSKSISAVGAAHLVIAFTHPVDASSVHVQSFELQASGGDSGFAEGNERTVALAAARVAVGNPSTIVLTLAPDMARDDYRLRVYAKGNIPVLDWQARSLQEDYDAYFQWRP